MGVGHANGDDEDDDDSGVDRAGGIGNISERINGPYICMYIYM